MEAIDLDAVQQALDTFQNQDVYLHLETTNGAYASHVNHGAYSAGAYIRNAVIRFHLGKITGHGPYRIGLKTEYGWVYAEGLTDWEINSEGQLLLAGHDEDGKLAVSCELSHQPFQ